MDLQIDLLVLLKHLRAHAGGCRFRIFRAKMGSKLVNSCKPKRPADTNAAPKPRLRAYLFAASFGSEFSNYVSIYFRNRLKLIEQVYRIFCVQI